MGQEVLVGPEQTDQPPPQGFLSRPDRQSSFLSQERPRNRYLLDVSRRLAAAFGLSYQSPSFFSLLHALPRSHSFSPGRMPRSPLLTSCCCTLRETALTPGFLCSFHGRLSLMSFFGTKSGLRRRTEAGRPVNSAPDLRYQGETSFSEFGFFLLRACYPTHSSTEVNSPLSSAPPTPTQSQGATTPNPPPYYACAAVEKKLGLLRSYGRFQPFILPVDSFPCRSDAPRDIKKPSTV